MLFIKFYSENSQISEETVKFWVAKATKTIKILNLFRNADISNFFVKFQLFHKKYNQKYVPPKKKTLTLNVNVRRKEKVELENFM